MAVSLNTHQNVFGHLWHDRKYITENLSNGQNQSRKHQIELFSFKTWKFTDYKFYPLS